MTPSQTRPNRLLITALALVALAALATFAACDQPETSCNGEPAYCDGTNTRHFCTPDAARWETEACGDQALCRPEGCMPIVCSLGQTECSEDSTSLRTCAESGLAWKETLCPSRGVCLDTRCHNRACEMGEHRCADGHRKVLGCAENGTAWETLETCGAGQACDEATCQPVVCEPGSARCETDLRLLECRPSGTAWDVKDCTGNQVCARDACRSVVCTPGVTRCPSNFRTVEQCDASGAGWDVSETCDEADACTTEGCRPRVCMPGQWSCAATPDVRERCAASGTSWDLVSACPGGTACRDGACATRICEPNRAFCSADAAVVRQCDESGTLVVSETACPKTHSCQKGECVVATAPVGEVFMLDSAQGDLALTPGHYAAAVFDLSQTSGLITFPLLLSGDVAGPESAPIYARSAAVPPARDLPHSPLRPIPKIPTDRPPRALSADPWSSQAAPVLGDRRTFHVDDGSGWRLQELDAELRYQGRLTNFWEDIAATTRATRMSDTTLAQMSQMLDAGIVGRLLDLFGEPTDVDGNGRIDIFFTPYLPNDSAAAFVWPVTLFPPGTWYQGYDHGEIVYSMAPSAWYPPDTVVAILAHEITHLIAIGRRIEPWLDKPDTMPECRANSESYVEEGLAELGAAHSGLELLGSAWSALMNPGAWRLNAFIRTSYYDNSTANQVHYGLGAVLIGFLMHQAGGIEVVGQGEILDLGGVSQLNAIITGPCGRERLNLPDVLEPSIFPDWYRNFMGAMLMTTLTGRGMLGDETVPQRYTYSSAQPDKWFGGFSGIPLYRTAQQGILRRASWVERPTYLDRGGASFVSIIVGDSGASARVDADSSEVLMVRYLP